MIRNVEQCPKCLQNISLSNIKRHREKCKGSVGKRHTLDFFREFKISKDTYECPECNKVFSEKGISGHYWRVHTKEGEDFNANNPRKGVSFGLNSTLSEDALRRKVEGCKKGGRNSPGKCLDHRQEGERRRKISQAAKERGLGGYIKGSGRGKSGWYKGYWCDSSYELAWVLYHLDHGIPFKRNLEKFEYIYKNKVYLFLPDFILEDNTYVEIKGYSSEKEKAKIAQFKKPIIVLMKKDPKEIFSYVVRKYGKNFIELYEGNPYDFKECTLCLKSLGRRNKTGYCKKCFDGLKKEEKKSMIEKLK